MAHKFHYQDNSRPEARGELIDEKTPKEFAYELNNLVKFSNNVTMVGWRGDTGTYTIQSMLNEGKKVNLVEIYRPNCLLLNSQLQHPKLHIVNIDIRDFDATIPIHERELLIWQDGPEHLTMNDSIDIINRLKETYSKLIIATPKGMFEQGSMYGNDAETHLSAWEIEDYVKLGFKVSVLDERFLIGYWSKSE